MIDLNKMQTEDLIRCVASQSEPTVMADHPEACAWWGHWMRENGVSIEQIDAELETRAIPVDNITTS